MIIKSINLETVCGITSTLPDNDKPEVAFAGKSNVGKSSLINALMNRKSYARISATPGKTQTLNFYICNDEFYLVDVPGYGYAQRDKVTQKKFGLMIEEYLKTRENLVRVFMLVDSRIKPTENDILMYNYLKYFNIKTTIVATKYDKLKAKDRDKNIKNVASTLNLVEDDKVVAFSSVTKKGRDEVLNIIKEALDEE